MGIIERRKKIQLHLVLRGRVSITPIGAELPFSYHCPGQVTRCYPLLRISRRSLQPPSLRAIPPPVLPSMATVPRADADQRRP